MAIAFRNESHNINNGGSPTGTEPTGTVQGDTLIALCEMENNGTLTPPAGWTTIFSGTSATAQFNYCLSYIIRGASAPNLTWTFGASGYYELYIVGFSGCDTSNPIDASAKTPDASGTSINPDPPLVTAISSSAMALAICDNWNGSDTGGWTTPSGYTIVTNNATGNDCAIATKLLTSSGPENPSAFGNVGSAGGGSTATDYWAATITLSPPRVAATAIAWIRA